ncbi:flavoprotein [Streptomyces sp. NPDC005181]|uniref:flavoprotein n=1 Tax=Streptomyces sp. NPDC005181 TaxID=3156869 RepID=UPI0033BB7FD9
MRDTPRLPTEPRPHSVADCYVVAPASANYIAKLATGIADNQAGVVSGRQGGARHGTNDPRRNSTSGSPVPGRTADGYGPIPGCPGRCPHRAPGDAGRCTSTSSTRPGSTWPTDARTE